MTSTILICLLCSLLPPMAHARSAVVLFVPETRQRITEPVLSAWLDLGGPDHLGMPVTSVMDGESVQFFRLGALRIRPGSTVTVIPVGRELLSRPDPSRTLRTLRRQPAPPDAHAFTPLRRAPSASTVRFDRRTGHAVKGSMLAAYRANGGSAVLGAPLSEAHTVGGARVQWFERGRLEARLGPSGGNAGDADGVAPAPVGVELALIDGADLTPKRRGSLALLDLARLARGDAPPRFDPAGIEIPVIGVVAAIEPVGIVNNVMQTPGNPWNVGWYPEIGRPGGDGNTVMAGHVDWATIGPVVFWGLGSLRPGDAITLLDADGHTAGYVVYETFTVDATSDSTDIVGDQDGETLTLITCGGEWIGSAYTSRIIVRARRLEA